MRKKTITLITVSLVMLSIVNAIVLLSIPYLGVDFTEAFLFSVSVDAGAIMVFRDFAKKYEMVCHAKKSNLRSHDSGFGTHW